MRWHYPSIHEFQHKAYHDDRLVPTSERLQTMRLLAEILESVIRAAFRDEPLLFERIVICGSIGKGTATKNSSDLDLVMYFGSLSSHNIRDNMGSILSKAKKALDSRYPRARDQEWYDRYGLRYNFDEVQVDILVGSSRVHPRDFLRFHDPVDRGFLSASVSSLGVDFIKQQDQEFKAAVRLLKDWRDSYDSWESNCAPKSYLLEVIALWLWLQKKQSGSCSRTVAYDSSWTSVDNLIKDFFFEISKIIVDIKAAYTWQKLPAVRVVINQFYETSELPVKSGEPLLVKQDDHIGRRCAQALVIDPVNPTNNLWFDMEDGGRQFVQRAQDMKSRLCI